MISDDLFLPLSALNDLLFCERRCAMHRIEQVWVENSFTLEGTHAHRRADKNIREAPMGVRTVHGVLLQSRRLGLTGKADVIEFHSGSLAPRGTAPAAESEEERFFGVEAGPAALDEQRSLAERGTYFGETPFPVEYKRGKRRRWDNDDVQVCAQALCLEEMLGVAVPAGAVYHIKSKRRRDVPITDKLRKRTEEAARRLHELFDSGQTPPPVWKARCRGCSLLELCMPRLLGEPARLATYQRQLFNPVDLSGE